MPDKKNAARPIIIKREEVIEGGHHGGAWKVAYADFMTAMMAFFLLMWLLNITTDEQKHGIASFFNPMSDKAGSSSSDQSILETSPLTAPSSIKTVRNSNEEPAPRPDGKAMHQAQRKSGQQYGGKEKEGILAGSGVSILPPGRQDTFEDEDPSLDTSHTEVIPLGGPKTGAAENIGQVGQGNAAGANNGYGAGGGGNAQMPAESENVNLQQDLAALKDTLHKNDQLQHLDHNVQFKIGSDEIQIEMQDTAHHPMFDNGAITPNKDGALLLEQIGTWLSGLPEDISIVGTTDGVPYHLRQHNEGLSNWTLSEMRADKAREFLVKQGYPDRHIRSVEGRADRSLADPLHPEAAENRRIIIIIHRTHPLPNSFLTAGRPQYPTPNSSQQPQATTSH